MKFIRYGSLALQKARHWSIDAPMPAPKGIYAFPYGYLDYFYIWKGRGCDSNPRVQYLKDKTGRRLFYNELFGTPFQCGPSFSYEAFKQAFDEISARIEEENPQLPYSAIYRKRMWSMLKPSWAAYLQKAYHIKEMEDILSEPRKSWLMVMDNPDKPPRLLHNPYDPDLSEEQLETIPLDQKLHFLKGEDGKRIPVDNLIRPPWEPKRYWDDFQPLAWDDFKAEDFLREQSKHTSDSSLKGLPDMIDKLEEQDKYRESEALVHKGLRDWLARKGLRLEQLCPWPVYPDVRREWAVVYKTPHIFEYSGCIWHHLQTLVRHGEILRIVGDWCYTTISAYEDALRRAEPMLYARHLKASQKNNWHGGLENQLYWNAHVPSHYITGGFEVFIDSKLVEKKQN